MATSTEEITVLTAVKGPASQPPLVNSSIHYTHTDFSVSARRWENDVDTFTLGFSDQMQQEAGPNFRLILTREQLILTRDTIDALLARESGDTPAPHATARMQCAWCNVDEGESHIFGCPVLSLLEDR